MKEILFSERGSEGIRLYSLCYKRRRPSSEFVKNDICDALSQFYSTARTHVDRERVTSAQDVARTSSTDKCHGEHVGCILGSRQRAFVTPVDSIDTALGGRDCCAGRLHRSVYRRR